MTVELSEINKILADLENVKLTVVSRDEDEDFYDSKNQGGEGKRITIYKVKEGLFMQVLETSDSYGSTVIVKSISFVTPAIKEVQVYEKI